MENRESTKTPTATRRGFFAAVAAGAGAVAAVMGNKAKAADPAKSAGPVLFKRTAETEKYYRTLTRS